MKPKITWVLIADGGQAKVFEYGGSGAGLTIVEGMTFTQDHLRAGDIMADRAGRSFSSVGQGRSAYEPETDPVQAREASFMKHMADILDRKVQEGAFQRLVVAAAPTALGDLRQSLSKAVQATIVSELPKDLTNLPTDKLERHFEGILAI